MDRRRVLIIDEDRRTVDKLQELFVRSGFEAEIALTPSVGLNIVTERQMSVAVLSAKFGCDADWEMVRHIRKHDPSLPILLFNAPKQKGLSREARRVGVKRFLSMPVDVGMVHEEALKLTRN